jgi:glycerophosphoryl diester phosphodiesterase
MEQIIAHRGASGYAPENTLAAFAKAMSLGSQFIEFDVMLSADGEPFVFHDDSLKRTTKSRGEFGLVSAEYIKTLDAGRWYSKKFIGEKIPSLREVIEWLNTTAIQANIEIKPYPGQTEPTTIAVLTHINRFWSQNKKLPLVSSFDHSALGFCRQLSPEIPLGLLLDKWDDNWLQKAKDLDCLSVHLSRRMATKVRVAAVKQAGYLVYVYTINRKRKAIKLLSWGVDAVFSNYPDLLV